MSRGRIARWMLEEVAVPYSTELLDYGTQMNAPEYLAINPMGKVPAIKHGNTVVTECAAICAYLADTFPAAGLARAASQRGDYYRWLFLTSGPLEQAITNKAMGFEVPDGRERMAGYGNFGPAMDTLEKTLEHKKYIAGDFFTAADVYVGSQLGWDLQFGRIEKRTAFADYWVRVCDRDAYRRASELDDAATPKDP